MARAAVAPTTLPTIIVRPENPAAEIAASIERTVADLQDIANAAALMKRDLKTEYPHGRVARAQVATLYAALINEVARVSGDLIGDVIRLGDDVLGVLTDRERRDSYTVVRDVVGDDWAAAFAGFAEREFDDEEGGYTTTEGMAAAYRGHVPGRAGPAGGGIGRGDNGHHPYRHGRGGSPDQGEPRHD